MCQSVANDARHVTTGLQALLPPTASLVELELLHSPLAGVMSDAARRVTSYKLHTTSCK